MSSGHHYHNYIISSITSTIAICWPCFSCSYQTSTIYPPPGKRPLVYPKFPGSSDKCPQTLVNLPSSPNMVQLTLIWDLRHFCPLLESHKGYHEHHEDNFLRYNTCLCPLLLTTSPGGQFLPVPLPPFVSDGVEDFYINWKITYKQLKALLPPSNLSSIIKYLHPIDPKKVNGQWTYKLWWLVWDWWDILS